MQVKRRGANRRSAFLDLANLLDLLSPLRMVNIGPIEATLSTVLQPSHSLAPLSLDDL